MIAVRGLVMALVAAAAVGSTRVDAGEWCPTFGYGNVGFASGYGMSLTRVGWCGPRFGGCLPAAGWCGPSWGWGCRPLFCGPRFGWGGPWWGGWRARCYESVYLASPGWGGATFFSGGVCPYPVPYVGYGYAPGFPATWVPAWGVPLGGVAYPYGYGLPAAIAPQFGPAGVLPYMRLAGATANPSAGAVVAAGDRRAPRTTVAARVPPAPQRAVAVRASNRVSRLRAARLVALGDRDLREAERDRAKLTAALDHYRRAIAAAPDQPDHHVREAVVLEALGRRDQADEALARAVAIDGRLGAGGDGAGPSDPVFDPRPADGRPALAVRGAEILAAIGRQAGGNEGARESLAWVSDRWSRRWNAGGHAIAAATR